MQITKVAYDNTSLTSQNSRQKETDNHFKQYMDSAQSAVVPEGKRYEVDTNQGNQKMDLKAYFSQPAPTAQVRLEDIPLILPSAHNLEVLSGYSQEAFKSLLSEYEIPSPPETIQFDDEGKLVLPPDYAYQDELKAAFEENPDVLNALQTTAAIASHVAAIQERLPLHQEMMAAKTEAERNQIIQKYSHLLNDDAPPHRISLQFMQNGDMLVTSDRNPETALA